MLHRSVSFMHTSFIQQSLNSSSHRRQRISVLFSSLLFFVICSQFSSKRVKVVSFVYVCTYIRRLKVPESKREGKNEISIDISVANSIWIDNITTHALLSYEIIIIIKNKTQTQIHTYIHADTSRSATRTNETVLLELWIHFPL